MQVLFGLLCFVTTNTVMFPQRQADISVLCEILNDRHVHEERRRLKPGFGHERGKTSDRKWASGPETLQSTERTSSANLSDARASR